MNTDISLDKDVASGSFGSLLQRNRITLGLSLQDVSTRLLLSTNQVRGLEADNRQAFYNDWFFVQATKKYANFLNLPLPEEMINVLDKAASVNKAASGKRGLTQHPTNRRGLGKLEVTEHQDRRVSTTIAASLVVLSVVGGFVALNQFKGGQSSADLAQNNAVTETQQLVAAKTEEASSTNTQAATSEPVLFTEEKNLEQKADKSEQKASNGSESNNNVALAVARPDATVAAVATTTDASAPSQNLATQALARASDAPQQLPSELKLAFKGECWVQMVSTDGTRVEKIYKEGDSLVLNLSTLKSIVLGNASATSLTAGPIDVPLNDFTIKGGVVARINASDLQTHIDRTN